MIARLAVGLSRLLEVLLALAALLALLVGVPWGLVTFIGWPLPDHIPNGDEVEAILLNPLSVTLLLDILACIAWPTWLLFVVDVARCVPDVVRGVRPASIGPVHAVASALVAGVVLGFLQPRLPATASARPATPVPAVLTVQDGRTPSRTPASDTDAHAGQGTVLVQPPQNGTYDSLWRIGERTLGDGRRWVDLYQLNQGRPQPDGDTLRDPDLIQPGWVLQLPGDTAARPPPPPQPAAPPAAAPSPAPAPAHTSADARTARRARTAARHHHLGHCDQPAQRRTGRVHSGQCRRGGDGHSPPQTQAHLPARQRRPDPTAGSRASCARTPTGLRRKPPQPHGTSPHHARRGATARARSPRNGCRRQQRRDRCP